MVRLYAYQMKPGFVTPYEKNWVDKYAYDMLKNRTGRCYSYAAAFCVYAKELGYDAKVIVGRTRGSGGGYVPHAWVEIKHDSYTYVYDTELADELHNENRYYRKTYGQVSGVYMKL